MTKPTPRSSRSPPERLAADEDRITGPRRAGSR